MSANPIHRILVLRLSSLGDVILTSPVYRLLRNKFPSAQIDVMVKKEFADVLRYNPNINSVIEFGSPRELPLRIIRNALKLRSYDVVIDLHNSLRTRLLRFGIAKNILSLKKAETNYLETLLQKGLDKAQNQYN